MFKFQIDLGNDAMKTPADVAKAMRGVAKMLRTTGDGIKSACGLVKDVNGNACGKWEFEAEEK